MGEHRLRCDRAPAGWPLTKNDLPPAPDPNYCIEDAA